MELLYLQWSSTTKYSCNDVDNHWFIAITYWNLCKLYLYLLKDTKYNDILCDIKNLQLIVELFLNNSIIDHTTGMVSKNYTQSGYIRSCSKSQLPIYWLTHLYKIVNNNNIDKLKIISDILLYNNVVFNYTIINKWTHI